MGRSEQSVNPSPAPAKGLGPTKSLSISHIILLVLTRLGQLFSPHKALWSQIKAKWMLNILKFLGIVKYSFYISLDWKDRAVFVITRVSWKSRQSEDISVFFCPQLCYLLWHILLNLNVVGWKAQVEEPDVRLTIINNGTKQRPAGLTLPRDSQPPKSDERSAGAQGHSSNGPP